MASEQRKMIEKMIDHSNMSDFQKDTVLTNFDFAIARERLEYCKLRNKISGLLAGMEAEVKEATIIEEMHQS